MATFRFLVQKCPIFGTEMSHFWRRNVPFLVQECPILGAEMSHFCMRGHLTPGRAYDDVLALISCVWARFGAIRVIWRRLGGIREDCFFQIFGQSVSGGRDPGGA